MLAALQLARAQRRRVALVTHLASGRQALIEAEGPLSILLTDPDLELTAGLTEAVSGVLKREASAVLEIGADRFFVHVFHPALRLAVVGAVHIAQSLVSIAVLAGYSVTLIDPRGAWATPERFPSVHIDRRWPAEALAELSPDRRTAVVTLTHDPKLDDPALLAALASEAFYVGALGSRRTQARRVERLKEFGVGESALTRIHGPVGLDIGAVSPAEIAISIMAELTGVLSKARGS